MPLVHHELCFGCGRSNLFGLLLEAEWTGEASVAGRCFIKQDHQGAEPGTAHEGIVAAALIEAMALACGKGARAREVTVQRSRTSASPASRSSGPCSTSTTTLSNSTTRTPTTTAC